MKKNVERIILLYNWNEHDIVNNYTSVKKKKSGDFPGGTVDKTLPTNAENMGLIPSPGRVDMLQSNQAHVPLTTDVCVL